MLTKQRAGVQSLVKELDPACHMVQLKKKKKRERERERKKRKEKRRRKQMWLQEVVRDGANPIAWSL